MVNYGDICKIDSFVFYRSFYEALKYLDSDSRLKAYNAICEYALNGTVIDMEGAERAVFELVKPQIDANEKRRITGQKNGAKGAEFGVLGGRPKKPQENPKITPKKPLKNPQETPNEPQANPQKPSNVNVNDNVNVNVNNNIIGRFTPPGLEEVTAYCRERNNNVNPQMFIDFYESKGWMIGKNKMKDWKAAVRTWERDRTTTKKQDYPQRQYSDDEYLAFERKKLGIGG